MSRKTKIYVIGIVIITIIVFALYCEKSRTSVDILAEDLKRPQYGDEESTLPVSVYVEGDENSYDLNINLKTPEYSKEEAEEVFNRFKTDIEKDILGDNESLGEVTNNLNLITEKDGLPLEIRWYSDDYEIVDNEGKVHNTKLKDKAGVTVQLTAVIVCGEYSSDYKVSVHILPKELSDEERLISNIEAEIDKAQDNSDEILSLPYEIDGKKVAFKKRQKRGSPIVVLILGAAAVAAVIAGDYSQKRKALSERKMQLEYDYCELVSKLTLLMGAGMTVMRAWERIVADYKRKNKPRFVYEEMSESYNQLKAGIPEIVVYERFGQRCGLKEYLKLSSLITQNIKKGTKELSNLLELETLEAFENRKNLAKKYGEEAGTKLLFPMIILLVIVMIIIMIPAMVSFGV